VAVSGAYPTHLAGYGKMKTGHVGLHSALWRTLLYLLLGFLPRGSLVFSIDLSLLALCQYRLCNISDHTISVFGIKACIRRMSHIMFSASCQPLTVPRSFDPSCITTNQNRGRNRG
jgi:hypothetical protein